MITPLLGDYPVVLWQIVQPVAKSNGPYVDRTYGVVVSGRLRTECILLKKHSVRAYNSLGIPKSKHN